MDTLKDIMNYEAESTSTFKKIDNDEAKESILMGCSSQENADTPKSGQNTKLLQSPKASQQLVPEVSHEPTDFDKELANQDYDHASKNHMLSNSPPLPDKRSSNSIIEEYKNPNPTEPLKNSLSSHVTSANLLQPEPERIQESENNAPAPSEGEDKKEERSSNAVVGECKNPGPTEPLKNSLSSHITSAKLLQSEPGRIQESENNAPAPSEGEDKKEERSSNAVVGECKNPGPTEPLKNSLSSHITSAKLLQPEPEHIQESENNAPAPSEGDDKNLVVRNVASAIIPQKVEISRSKSTNLINTKNQKPSKKSLTVNFTPTQSRFMSKVDTWNRQDVNHQKIKENLLIKRRIFESREYLLENSSKRRRSSHSSTFRRARIEAMARPKSPIQIQPPKLKTPVQIMLPLKPKTPPQIPQTPKNKNKSQALVLPSHKKSSSSSKSATVVRSDDLSINTEDITFEVDDDSMGNLKSSCSSKDTSNNCPLPNQDICVNKELLLTDSKTRLMQKGLVITTKSFKATDWTPPLESLTVEKCVYFVSPDNLKSSRETLKFLKFSNLTSYQNIETVLRNCCNLAKLSFSNVIIVQKKFFKPGEHTQIQLPRLKSLEIVEWNRRITKYAYWLLNFFNRGVISPTLESFTLQGADYLSDKSAIKSKLQNSVDPSAVINFLLKHRSSLKKISVGGAGFQMMGTGVSMAKSLQDLNHLQITSIRATANAEHLDVLLNSQQKIQNIVLSGFIERFEPDLKAMIYSCLRKNKESLASFILSPCLVSDDIFKIHYGKIYNFDCGVFQDCRHLKNIIINIAISPQIFSQRSACGKIFNLQSLPFTLVSLELYHEEFQTQELTAFAANFPKYVNLSKLVLSTSKTHPYYIHLSWVKSLVKLKHLLRADFYSGKLHDFKGVCQFMLSKPKGFITMTTLADRVSFCRAWLESRQSVTFKASSTISSVNKNSKL